MGFEIVYGIGAAILLAALVWGTFNYRNRRRGEKLVGDDIVRERYRKNDA